MCENASAVVRFTLLVHASGRALGRLVLQHVGNGLLEQLRLRLELACVEPLQALKVTCTKLWESEHYIWYYRCVQVFCIRRWIDSVVDVQRVFV